MLAFALAIFTSAFLLFQIQPLIAKFILPWFGGGTAVWGVSMLFFQTCLVAGYAYAHLLVHYLKVRQQAIVHLVLLTLALTQLPVSPASTFEPNAAADPTLQILLLLARTIGLPFFVLSATAPLIQAWVSRTRAVSNPYRLYALSNAASLLALLSYPFLVEPLMTRQTQVMLWSGIFAVFLTVCAFCAYSTGFRLKVTELPARRDGAKIDAPSKALWLLWLALPATAVALLLGVTNQLTRDLVSVPFLWVLPLSIYLLTFIICFDSERWYRRGVFIPGMIACVAAMLYLLIGDPVPVPAAIAVYNVSLFALCMVCHGELNKLRPEPRYLTGFYLMIAIGGALGSALVAVAMPLLSDRYIELQLGIGAVLLLTVITLAREAATTDSGRPALPVQLGVLAALVVTSGLLVYSARDDEPDIIYQSRNFYGVLTVGRDYAGTEEEALWLRNGTSYHGAQIKSPKYHKMPVAYYAPRSGVSLALNYLSVAPGRRIGMIGLGVGSVAGYAVKGDYLKIYEINPEVVRIANEYFTYLSNTKADVEIVLGDARLSLEQEPPQAFDVFILDAFSSDAIPVHLLTREAFELYLSHLEPDGVIAVLISSWHFDFAPLLHEMAAEFGLNAVLIDNNSDVLQDWGSQWIIMTKNETFIRRQRIQQAMRRPRGESDDIRLWTDDFSSPFQLLK